MRNFKGHIQSRHARDELMRSKPDYTVDMGVKLGSTICGSHNSLFRNKRILSRQRCIVATVVMVQGALRILPGSEVEPN